ncbi:MAG: GNAT family N-acetyltransferase, partial [Bdellovibrionales bacterium]|nr:GNAT family N-acetyltransferase [Bdellovibrionales bacterium]
PEYHWGNYVIFDQPPQRGDLKKWTQIFDQEFNYYKEPHHYTFTWDRERNEKGEYKEFLDAHFSFDSGVVLSTDKLNSPTFPNDSLQIKKILSDKEWNDVVDLQVLCADPKFFNDEYKKFKQEQMKQYRKMASSGLGNWYGAYLNNVLVGDLGIFHDNENARYQNVETHPEYRRQGICGTLVYKSGAIAFEESGIKNLVMEADPDYHAARIYESVGFQPKETNYALSWWKGKK